MTAAAYTSDLDTVFLFESTSGVSAYGGGAAGLTAEADFAMEGTNAVDKQVTSSADKGFLAAITAPTIGADDHFYGWIYSANFGINDTYENHGIHFSIGDDTSNFVKFHVDGINTRPLGGGQVYAIRFVNTASTNQRTLVGTPGTAPDSFGGGLNVTGNAKDVNLGCDGYRIGWGYTITGGTGADPEADFDGIADDDESTSEGVFRRVKGGFELLGKLKVGTSGAACELLASNTNIFFSSSFHHLADFGEVLLENASSIMTLTNVNFVSTPDIFPTDGSVTTNRGRVENISGAFVFANVGFIGIDDTILGSSDVVLGNWVNTGQIALNGADISGSNILTPTVAADTGAVLDDRTTSSPTTISELDNCTFEQGANNHHAIDFGTGVTHDITLRGIEFTNFDDTSGEDQPGAALRFLATSGSLTCNLIGCTVDGVGASASNFFKDDAAGIAVTLAFDSITLSVTVLDATDDTPITTAHVQLLKDSDKSVLLSGAVNGSGVISDSIAYDTDTDLIGWAREHNVSGTDYTQQDFSGQYTSNGFSIVIRLEPAE